MRVTVNDLEHAKMLEQLNITELAFPTKFSTHHQFLSLEEIFAYKTKMKKLLIVKGIIHNRDLKEIEEILISGEDYLDGIIFSDFAIKMICEKLQLNYDLIYDGEMLNTSVAALNEIFKHNIDECVISRELTLEEINYMAANADHKLSMQVQGLYPIFYSVRKLVDNFLKKIEYDDILSDVELSLKGRKGRFKVMENERGCVIYTNFEQCLVEKLSLFKDIEFWIDQPFISNENNFEITKMYLEQGNDLKYTKGDIAQITNLVESIGFLHKKTLYKLKHE